MENKNTEMKAFLHTKEIAHMACSLHAEEDNAFSINMCIERAKNAWFNLHKEVYKELLEKQNIELSSNGEVKKDDGSELPNKVKRYAIFAGYINRQLQIEKVGGWHNYQTSFNDLEEAKKAVHKLQPDPNSQVYDFHHIIDLHTGEIVHDVCYY